ncbi:unnamed protein product [Paramecium primaurelia]|nr:unnamed protein product [Paramecium primaurelia]
MQNVDGPDDLNINYYYSNEKGEEVKIDIENYEIDDISDLNNQNDSLEEGNSLFDDSCVMISPNHYFILINVNVEILRKKELQRLIIIDVYNHKIQKLFDRSNFLGDTNPQLSIDVNNQYQNGCFGILKIEFQQFYTFQLINQCQEQNMMIIQIFFLYDTFRYNILIIIQFQKITISINQKDRNIKFNSKSYQFLENHDTHLYIFVDYLALIVNQKGQHNITRIKNNCKIKKKLNF